MHTWKHSHKKNNTHIHTASGSSSVSYITDCQTSIFIEVSSFNERHALPAAVLVSLAVNLPSPSGKTYSKRLCQFGKSWLRTSSVMAFGANASWPLLVFWLKHYVVWTPTNATLSLLYYHKLKCTDVCVCVFVSMVSGRGREPWGRHRGVTYKRL